MTCDRNEPLPVPLTSMVSEPSPLTAPPMTLPPVFFVTGVDSRLASPH